MQHHLVSFEYGLGAVWGYVAAPSAEEILAAAPEVDVHDEPPVWFEPEDLERLRRRTIVLEDGSVVDSLLHRGPRY
ncbi:MAG TPA: hypothetical protein ENK55_05295 [Actinobacteria bacterium]|nr:hypothetical protein [Actinomycetota bacterium]